MTSQLKIRCLLKTTAKRLWTRQRGEGRKKKSCFEKGGGGGGWGGDRKSEFVTAGECEISLELHDRDCCSCKSPVDFVLLLETSQELLAIIKGPR